MRLLPQVLTAAAATMPKRALPATMSAATDFIEKINYEYEKLHKDFEYQFWGTKMALGGSEWSVPELTRTKAEMEAFLASKEKLAQTRELLSSTDITDEERKTLKIFERTFGCYIMESADALKLRETCMQIEGTLEDSRNKMKLGATIGGEFVELSSVGLRARMRVDSDEAARKACYDGVKTIGDFVTANGFVELVKARNAMAKSLGYVDYYDYKVTQAEGLRQGGAVRHPRHPRARDAPADGGGAGAARGREGRVGAAAVEFGLHDGG